MVINNHQYCHHYRHQSSIPAIVTTIHSLHCERGVLISCDTAGLVIEKVCSSEDPNLVFIYKTQSQLV